MKSKRTAPPKLPEGQFERIRVSDVTLDRRNPRLVEYGVKSNTTEDEVLKILWNEMAVDEVAMSIAACGFWTHEPLVVTEEKGKLVVIEGNRRLAAARILCSPGLRTKLRATDLPTLSEKKLEALKELPVVRVANREEAWPYIGFKHVNGPRKWRSYPKAQYIAYVKKTTGVSLSKIATQIGDRHRTVQRLYRALMVTEQAENAGVNKHEWFFKRPIAFSHLMTAFEYEGFANFLELADEDIEAPNPVGKKRYKELGELCTWLWGDKRGDGIKPVIHSQDPDLRNLVKIVSNREALAALRAGDPLDVAFEVSKGNDVVFEEALNEAKRSLIKAQGRVSAGYNGEPHLLGLADTVVDMADDVATVMHRRSNELRPI